MLLKNSYLLPDFYCNMNLNSGYFTAQNQSSIVLILKIEMLLLFQNKRDSEIIRFSLMHFGFALELWDIDLRNIELLDTNLHLLDTDIPRKYFACLHNEDVSDVTFYLPRRLQNVLKTSWRRKIVNQKACWSRL